jgi:hypothetical protein
MGACSATQVKQCHETQTVFVEDLMKREFSSLLAKMVFLSEGIQVQEKLRSSSISEQN